MQLSDRIGFAEFLNGMGLTGKAVEVGVAEGSFAGEMLSRWNGESYTLIDPWKRYEGYTDLIERGDDILEAQYQGILSRFGKDDRVSIVRDFSLNSSKRFDDESLCFVYLDACHDYTSVRDDIKAWWPKVARGGVFAGHDHRPGFGVSQAVDEFIASTGLQKNLTGESDYQSWWLIK